MRSARWAIFPISLLICGMTPNATGADLSGTYDTGTLTPLQRAEAYGDNLFLTPEQAQQMSARLEAALKRDAADSDPNRPAPPKGKFSAGYNLFWLDLGSGATLIDGKFRTSIITAPVDGRIPAMTPAGSARMKKLLDAWRIVWRNPDPTTTKSADDAWWLEDGNPDGPYDHLEQRPLAERCIIGSRSTAGPPMLPNVYNNHKRVIQTPDSVMILTEMNHDARIVRIGGEHRPDHVRTWLGDSVGRWEGDVLIVETKNFNDTPALSGADRNLQVTEWLQRQPDGNLSYRFKVEDPSVWSSAWEGELTWQQTDDKVFEFACHEGNYALQNVMRGARVLESLSRSP